MLSSKIADAIGLSAEQAAEGIIAIANETMAGALRLVSVERGHDPQRFRAGCFGAPDHCMPTPSQS